MTERTENGFSVTQAKRLELFIIGFCLTALAFIFQPFSKTLFTLGCIGVVVGGLAFNLVPFCVPGSSYKRVSKIAFIVLLIFIGFVLIALASAWLYGVYLKAGR